MSNTSLIRKVGIAAAVATVVVGAYLIFTNRHEYTQKYVNDLKQGLGLSNPNVDELDMDTLANAWKSAPFQNGPTTIQLRSDKKTSQFDNFLDALQFGPIMDELSINFPLQNKNIEVLKEALQNNKIKTINFMFFYSALSQEQRSAILQAIQKGNGMEKVSFLYSPFDSTTLPQIFPLFSKVSNIEFKIINITNKNAQDIADAIVHSSSKQILILTENTNVIDYINQFYTDSLNEQGMNRLKSAFDQNPSIQSLGVDGLSTIPQFPKELQGWQIDFYGGGLSLRK